MTNQNFKNITYVQFTLKILAITSCKNKLTTNEQYTIECKCVHLAESTHPSTTLQLQTVSSHQLLQIDSKRNLSIQRTLQKCTCVNNDTERCNLSLLQRFPCVTDKLAFFDKIQVETDGSEKHSSHNTTTW